MMQFIHAHPLISTLIFTSPATAALVTAYVFLFREIARSRKIDRAMMRVIGVRMAADVHAIGLLMRECDRRMEKK